LFSLNNYQAPETKSLPVVLPELSPEVYKAEESVTIIEIRRKNEEVYRANNVPYFTWRNSVTRICSKIT